MTGVLISPTLLSGFVGVAVFGGLIVATKLDGLRAGLPATLIFSATCAALCWALTTAPVPLGFALWTVVMLFGLAALAAIDGATHPRCFDPNRARHSPAVGH